MAIVPAYTNEKCFCERGNYGEGATKIVCGEAGGPQHWAHTRCQRQWAQQKRTEEVPDDEITCPLLGAGACKTKLAHLLPPSPQKSYQELARTLAVSVSWFTLGVGLFWVGTELETIALNGMRKSRAFRGPQRSGVECAAIGLGGAVSIAVGATLGGLKFPEVFWGPPGMGAVLLNGIASCGVGLALNVDILGWGQVGLFSGGLTAITAISTYALARKVFGWF